MSTMTVTLYSTTANTAATAARPERFDLIMVLPLGSGNIHKTRTHPRPPPAPQPTLFSNAPCSVLRIFQIIITMLLWQITAVHLRAPVSCVRFAAQQRTCCALQFSVVAVAVVCGVSLCRRASSQVRMPQQVKLKLPRARALGGILSTQMSSSGSGSSSSSSSSNISAAVRDSRPQCGCGDARITTLVCVCVCC